MKKIINGNSSCMNCINYCDRIATCSLFIKEQVANGLKDCTTKPKLNYIEEETEMKLTKAEKKNLSKHIAWFIECGGIIHIMDNGITRVYLPVIKSDNCRMYGYGQSICNPTDKYKKKIGIMLALEDFNNTEKTIPVELLELLGQHVIEQI